MLIHQALIQQVIGRAIEVHRTLGPGLLESIYRRCLEAELRIAKVPFRSEVPLPIRYKNTTVECLYRLDLLVAGSLIVEVKSVERLLPVHTAQVLTYLRITGFRHGLLMNFHSAVLRDGLKSVVNVDLGARSEDSTTVLPDADRAKARGADVREHRAGDNRGMSYIIRRARPEDAPALADHRVAMFREMRELSDQAAAEVGGATEQIVAPAIAAGEFVAWVAELDGTVVAGAGLFVRPLLPREGRLQHPCETYVLNLYTEPAHRRRGLAARIMEEVVAWSRQHGACRVALHASAAGQPLYEKLGFKRTNEWRLDF